MASAQSGTDAGDRGDPLPDNRLFDLYREYIGEPEAEIDVYLGFGLFFGGIVLAGLALALFVWSGTYTPRTPGYFARAMPAYALGMLSLPAAMLGIVVLLPVEKRALYGASGGAAVTLLAVLGFVFAYPYQWNSTTGADYTVEIVAVYAVGLTAVVAATGAALVAHQIARAKPGPGDIDIEAVEDEGPEPGDAEYYTDEEIRQDIEEQMEKTEITWGGVEKTESRRLELEMETEIDASGMNIDPDTTRSSGVEAQVQGLKQLKGGEQNTATGSTVDDQTAALTELRKQKRESEREGDDGTSPSPTAPTAAKSGRSGPGGLLGWIRGLLN